MKLKPLLLALLCGAAPLGRAADFYTPVSGLNEGTFIAGTPASAANLAVSELHYNPPSSADAGEFVEVMNISAQTIDLSGAGFDTGIQFAFAAGTTLAPGERAIVAANAADFSDPRVRGA